MASWKSRLAAAADARQDLFEHLGEPSARLAPEGGPGPMGGPPWPARPGWRVIRRRKTVIVSSDGLSDPWEDRPGAGFGIEVYAEAKAKELPTADDAGLGNAGTWLFHIVHEVSQLVARHGGVRGLLDELGTITTEASGQPFPRELVNADGRVGLMLNVHAEGPRMFETPEGIVRFAPITLLTPAELAYVVAGGDPARATLAEKLAASGSGHLSALGRKSVVV